MLVHGLATEVAMDGYRTFGAERYENIALLAVRHDAVEDYPDKVIGTARLAGWHFWRWVGADSDDEEGFKLECDQTEAEFATLMVEVNVGHMQVSFDAH